MNSKTAKACEPCRLRKTRCNGAQPCQRRECQDAPKDCVYRSKIRTRKPRRVRSETPSQPQPQLLGSGHSVDGLLAGGSPSSRWGDLQAGVEDNGPRHHPEVYHSVTETHLSPTSTDSSQLFYGPSSYFAFLQQIHRGVLSKINHGQPVNHEVRSGIDTFMQRSIFFGTPPRINPEAIRSAISQLPAICREVANDFLKHFKDAAHHRLPFYTTEELDALLENLYDPRSAESMPPQTKASFLVILAIGALSTPQTDLAETLFTEAKREAVILDDTVTLKTLQLSILFADYQVNMGRPNSTYLHLGAACRKAFALGLNIGALSINLDGLTLQKHEATIWTLYFHETHQALTLGRRSGLRLADIECPFPTDTQPMVRFCRMARIMEDAAESIYGKKADSLRQLYITAEQLYIRLRQVAEECGIATAHSSRLQGSLETHESINLNNLYYHAITLIFRPFLVASHVLNVSGGTGEIKDMWLRQACRYAVDAAQDSIEFSSNTRISDLSGGSRYYVFFLECSTAVLLYDVLCHPSKYSFNMEYINKAIQVLSGMVPDEPVLSSLNSLHRVLETIERSISGQIPGLPLASRSSSIASPNQHSRIQFPSLDQLGMNEHERVLLLTGNSHAKENGKDLLVSGEHNPLMDQGWTDPSHFNLNVMTTDLFNFFPLDLSTPPWPNT